jgi:hypothetical protein
MLVLTIPGEVQNLCKKKKKKRWCACGYQRIISNWSWPSDQVGSEVGHQQSPDKVEEKANLKNHASRDAEAVVFFFSVPGIFLLCREHELVPAGRLVRETICSGERNPSPFLIS